MLWTLGQVLYIVTPGQFKTVLQIIQWPSPFTCGMLANKTIFYQSPRFNLHFHVPAIPALPCPTTVLSTPFPLVIVEGGANQRYYFAYGTGVHVAIQQARKQ